MKSDYYLQQCLEQAALSPLRRRHGCIVVKGGKIIGQGFNDVRSGFDGGALKTGRLAAGSSPLDGASSASDTKHKRKSRSKAELNSSSLPTNNTPIPIEAADGGAGHYANTSLSMHSEMMAINSALSASSIRTGGTASHGKPYFKLSASGKRKRLLRNYAVEFHVE